MFSFEPGWGGGDYEATAVNSERTIALDREIESSKPNRDASERLPKTAQEYFPRHRAAGTRERALSGSREALPPACEGDL